MSVHHLPVPATLEPHVIAAIRETVRAAIADYLPARAGGVSPPASPHPDVTHPAPGPLPRTADIRGIRVHLDGAMPTTFTRHRRSPCPRCNQRLPLNSKIVGFERVDSPDLLVWVCHRCAERLKT